MMDPRLQRLHLSIEAAIRGLSAEQAAWHPPGKWCTAEVLEHLYLTYTATTKGFGKVMEAGKPLATASNFSNKVGVFVVTGLGYLPTGRQSPPQARPRGIAPEKILEEIGPQIAVMDAMIGECAQKFGARKKLLDHPILGPLTAGQWCKFHLIHGLHHVKQIRRLRISVSERHP